MKTLPAQTHMTFWTLGATDLGQPRNGSADEPRTVGLHRRLSRLPGAVLLTAGYYAGKSAVLSDLIRRSH
jgi:hypothetical protein